MSNKSERSLGKKNKSAGFAWLWSVGRATTSLKSLNLRSPSMLSMRWCTYFTLLRLHLHLRIIMFLTHSSVCVNHFYKDSVHVKGFAYNYIQSIQKATRWLLSCNSSCILSSTCTEYQGSQTAQEQGRVPTLRSNRTVKVIIPHELPPPAFRHCNTYLFLLYSAFRISESALCLDHHPSFLQMNK